MPTWRVPDCGHGEITKAKGLCPKCYYAARYIEKGEQIRAQQREYAAANREKVARRVKAWKEENRERYLETARAYYWANRDRQAANYKARMQQPGHQKVRRVREAGRRARKRNGIATLTAAEWNAILDEFAHRCAYCNLGDLPLVQEHMTPLSRGGAHDAKNVVPACGPCNGSKHAKTALEWIGPSSLRTSYAREARH